LLPKVTQRHLFHISLYCSWAAYGNQVVVRLNAIFNRRLASPLAEHIAVRIIDADAAVPKRQK
ncbi:hypothetical protein, partial [Klebsiella michiganensis]|uniref:hypothetical protein n=1 Tax=Klebsiella michiganensis TaxID=1134687 RepID=UPI001BD646F7